MIDSQDEQGIDQANKWIKSIEENIGEGVIVALVRNKMDIASGDVNP